MPVTLENMLAEFSPKQRAEIARGGREIALQNRTIAQLRKDMNLTQAQVAKALSVTQASVAEMEARDDMMVSTVGRIVSAMGGEVELVAKLPNKGVFAIRLGRTAGQATKVYATKAEAPAAFMRSHLQMAKPMEKKGRRSKPASERARG